MLHIVLCSKGNGKRSGNPLSQAYKKGAVHVDLREYVLCLKC
jgi:hypothetical protein